MGTWIYHTLYHLYATGLTEKWSVEDALVTLMIHPERMDAESPEVEYMDTENTITGMNGTTAFSDPFLCL